MPSSFIFPYINLLKMFELLHIAGKLDSPSEPQHDNDSNTNLLTTNNKLFKNKGFCMSF